MSELLRQRGLWTIFSGVLIFAVAGAEGAAPADELSVDPTIPLFFDDSASDTNDAAARNTGYTLNSILTRGDTRIAVINSQRVRVGETVGAATVSAITENTVTLDIAGRTQVLQLYKSAIRTPAGDGG